METSNKPRKALILTADQFEDMEVFYPLYRLQEEGWEVTVAAPHKEEIHGKHAYSLIPDAIINAIVPDEYELLILPGGSKDGAPGTVSKIQKAKDIATSFMEKNKIVAAICHGPYTLISADQLKGRLLTSTTNDVVPAEIRKAGANWENREVIVDNNLITSRSPRDLPAFMREVLKKFS